MILVDPYFAVFKNLFLPNRNGFFDLIYNILTSGKSFCTVYRAYGYYKAYIAYFHFAETVANRYLFDPPLLMNCANNFF